ncbi:MAG TPA: hypothetical protein VLR89_04685 [Anaerolineaceae bacterium]|nr:hypothetical protein [Anaerolineaceae bacterium]
MPSIDLIRLRKQIARLGIFLEVPEEFVSEYKGLLEFYHHWSHLQQEDRIPNSFMLMYDLPPQVISEIELGLKHFLQSKPNVIFALVDALRKDLHFECSGLAAFMLGQISEDNVEPLKEYLANWLESPLDKALVETIFLKSTVSFQKADQEAYLVFLQSLLKSANKRLANSGLIGLRLFLPSIKVDNLPRLFNMVSPLIQDRDVRQENLEVLIQELAKKSPVETGYLIRQVLSDTEGRRIETLARAFLEYLPEETAESVARAIKLHAARII